MNRVVGNHHTLPLLDESFGAFLCDSADMVLTRHLHNSSSLGFLPWLGLVVSWVLGGELYEYDRSPTLLKRESVRMGSPAIKKAALRNLGE